MFLLLEWRRSTTWSALVSKNITEALMAVSFLGNKKWHFNFLKSIIYIVKSKVILKAVPERLLIVCAISLAKFNCKLEPKVTFFSAIINIKTMVD